MRFHVLGRRDLPSAQREDKKPRIVAGTWASKPRTMPPAATARAMRRWQGARVTRSMLRGNWSSKMRRASEPCAVCSSPTFARGGFVRGKKTIDDLCRTRRPQNQRSGPASRQNTTMSLALAIIGVTRLAVEWRRRAVRVAGFFQHLSSAVRRETQSASVPCSWQAGSREMRATRPL